MSKESLLGIMNQTWNLSSVTVSTLDATSENVIQKSIEDFNNNEFISEWGGYAPIQLSFFSNHLFEATYQIDGDVVKAKGQWSIQASNIILTQSSGDNILLTNATLMATELTVGYEYLSSDYGINKLIFKKV